MVVRKTAIKFWFLVGIIMLNCTFSSISFAEDAPITKNTVFYDNAPLLITSYKTQSSGTDIAFLEIYNSGSQLVNLNGWQIVDTVNNRNLDFRGSMGSVKPNSHIVISRPSVVIGASFTINGWYESITLPKVINNLQLKNPNYRPVDLQIKIIDKWSMRSYLTASYSSTSFTDNYRDLFDDKLYLTPDEPSGLKIVEIYPYASTCSPFDTSVLCGDYVKILNNSNQDIVLDDFVLRTDSSSVNRTNSNTVSLHGILRPDDFYLVNLTDVDAKLSLTNSGGYIWLEDTWGVKQYVNLLTKYESAGINLQGYAYAYSEYDGTWKWTTTPTPFGDNTFTDIPLNVCPDGKYLNLETSRCRTLEDTLNAISSCEEGYERNIATNRCRKVISSANSLTPCKANQVRNPATNRCIGIKDESSKPVPCREGYERNPATNRCRKVAVLGSESAKYPVEPINKNTNASATWWVLGLVALGAVGYGIWEWRQELTDVFKKILRIINIKK